MDTSKTHVVLLRGDKRIYITADQAASLQMMLGSKRPKRFMKMPNGESIATSQIISVGATDHRKQKAERIESAVCQVCWQPHPAGHCPKDIVSACEDCGTALSRSAMEYLQFKKHRRLCRECLYGTPPIEQRYDLNDPEQRAAASQMAYMEGVLLAQDRRRAKLECPKGVHQETKAHRCKWCGNESKQIELALLPATTLPKGGERND